MPQLLKTLDEIAREKRRDVLCVMFFNPEMPIPKQLNAARRKLRSTLIKFLDEQSIAWSECFEPPSKNLLIYPYYGSLYIDVPYDLANAAYRMVADYLETADGEPRYDDMRFCVLTLDDAIKNADDRRDPEDS